jgi:glutathione S-transferase
LRAKVVPMAQPLLADGAKECAGTMTTTTSARAPRAKAPAAKNSSKPSGKTVRTAVATKAKPKAAPVRATLTLSSRNYSSWSLRGWLLVRFAGLAVEEVVVPPDDAAARRELLLLAPSILVPCLTHDGVRSWNVMAIAYYLDEIRPDAGLLPAGRAARAHCRSICGEMNSGFANLRSSLPMNLRARHKGHKVWAGAVPDIERITEIWRECLKMYGGPYLFGAKRTMADAMFAPVATRFLTYDVKLDAAAAAYCKTVMAMPEMQEWVKAAQAEPDDIEELDMDF